MAIALVALFVALSGGAYAAANLGKNSVRTVNIHGSAVTNPKIADNAVTYNKIKPSSVGTVRIVKSEVQARLKNACTNGQTISAVDDTGKVTCTSAQPALTNSAASTSAVTLGASATNVATLSLAGGSGYQVQADPSITVTPSTVGSANAQHVVVSCTLAGGTSTAAVDTKSVSTDVAAFADSPQVETLAIPLIVAAPSSANAQTANVTCSAAVTTLDGSAATNPAAVTTKAQIFALQAGVATTTTTTPTTTTTTTAS